ncbi:hypothetical protein [uncultured Alteromonas sp.]|tara:strand:+ start:3484 stop:3633 length:150 start_codon:yes stop_codon:yes gene_type:complete
MKEWLKKVENALSKALKSVDSSDEIPRENMYMLAPIIYSQVHNMNNGQL